MATQVTLEDGTESPLTDHMRDAHQKGTRGYTEEYLDGLHRNLHERKREPEEELEHGHPGSPRAEPVYGERRDQTERGTREANARNRDSEEQGMPGAMKIKNRDRNGKRTSESGNGQHRDRYQQQPPEVPDQRSREPRQQGDGQAPDGGRLDREAGHLDRDGGHLDREAGHLDRDGGHLDRDGGHLDRDGGEEQLAPAGGHQQRGGGKHRKPRS